MPRLQNSYFYTFLKTVNIIRNYLQYLGPVVLRYFYHVQSYSEKQLANKIEENGKDNGLKAREIIDLKGTFSI